MKPYRVPRSVTVAGLVLLGMVPAQGSPHAAGAEPLLRPTPLVLKDGRIAKVSIHVLPFASGQTELAAEPAEYLAKLTRAVGTDCFLTAQVIGHIASNEIAGDDTLNAHRLARSRADAVQASLIGGGLPAKAIASVWDWQFMVREPRATLWVFELTAGEDCEGRQLHGDLVAEAPATEGNAAPERVTKPAAAPAEPPAAAKPAAAPAEPPAAAKPAGTAAKPAVAAEKPAVAAEKPAVAAEKPVVAARSDAAAKAAQPSAARPPVVAQVEAGPSVAASPTARPQAEPGQARQAAANPTEPAPAAESKTAEPARPAEQPATAARQTAAQAARPAEQTATAEPQNVAAARPGEESPAAAAQTTAPAQPAEQPATAAPQTATPAQAAGQTATTAPQTVARAESAEQAAIAAAPAATAQSPAKPSTDDGKVEAGPGGGLIITFATNSSYFPSGAAARLRDLLEDVNGDRKFQVTLQVAVSGTTQVVGAKSADEAARYNKWLADRRVERVQAWLVKNVGAQGLSIRPEYVANDDSRRLTVRLAPVG
jgi:hypothetical protein